jgi:hypothetical protein
MTESAVSSAVQDVKARIDVIEKSYEFFLAYAAQGLTTDQGAKSGADLRDFLARAVEAVDGLPEAVASASDGVEPAGTWSEMVAVISQDAHASLTALRLVSARADVSSRLVDNLNASIHVRALLTDLWLVDELLG